MYHCTNRRNLGGILKKGLIPSKPKWIKNAICGVYLSERQYDWMHWVTNQSNEAGAMIEVDVKGLNLIEDNTVFEAKDNSPHPAFIYCGEIPPSRFTKIVISTDEKPCCFEEFGKMNKIQRLDEASRSIVEKMSTIGDNGSYYTICMDLSNNKKEEEIVIKKIINLKRR
jgi:hypothetical protein